MWRWFFNPLVNHFNAKRREFDLNILWPSCCEEAEGDLDVAKAAFAVHAFNDPAWQTLGDKAIFEAIDKLDWPNKKT